ncbi:hypothetical protein DPMN_000448 [Dreissena polymorpha]|uniref:Uncharacterized protein n=1 Tax=Dreissena polymorpha TaxID=45954 RepID=A0A9D4RPI0_DREPO|nr:hypothetical protein DPMN_000448 [Dreissena polymorpha]
MEFLKHRKSLPNEKNPVEAESVVPDLGRHLTHIHQAQISQYAARMMHNEGLSGHSGSLDA